MAGGRLDSKGNVVVWAVAMAITGLIIYAVGGLGGGTMDIGKAFAEVAEKCSLSPSEVREHPDEYLGKTIKVEGWYDSYFGILPKNHCHQLALRIDLPENMNLFNGAKYRFTGILVEADDSVKLVVSSVEPA
jgi:hypothetical protein